jgi:hypothetical protein
MLNPIEDYFWNKPHKRPTNRWMHYFPIYHRHFAQFRDRAPNVLEIGVSGGGGLYMWRDYFGADSTIVGIDIDEKSRISVGDDFPVYIGDQTDANLLREIQDKHGSFDIVIDDGGHKVSQQIASFDLLYANMPERGVYLVEDTHTNFWDAFKDMGDTTFFDFALSRAKELNDWSRQLPFQVPRFKTPLQDRQGELEASEFCRTTDSVAFYDSIVVFERTPRTEPYLVAR